MDTAVLHTVIKTSLTREIGELEKARINNLEFYFLLKYLY